MLWDHRGMALRTILFLGRIALLSIVFDTPEDGRDRLGRICETNGGSTNCRPDPAADHRSELARANRELRHQRWFQKD